MPIAATLGLAYGAHPRQRVDVLVPDGASSSLCVCVGGGWWADGRAEAQRGFALLLAERGVAVANLGHRPLGDGARHGGDVLDDLAEAAAKAAEEAQVLGYAGNSIAVLGHGSGSLAAIGLAVRLQAKSTVRAAIACGILASLEPNAGTAPAHQAACDRFAAGRHRELSPQHLAPSLVPPLFIMHGDEDRDVPLAQAQALHAGLVAAGEHSRLDVLAGAPHRFAEDALARTAREAADRTAAFLSEHAREHVGEDWSFGCKS